jgi:hypothetical protein
MQRIRMVAVGLAAGAAVAVGGTLASDANAATVPPNTLAGWVDAWDDVKAGETQAIRQLGRARAAFDRARNSSQRRAAIERFDVAFTAFHMVRADAFQLDRRGPPPGAPGLETCKSISGQYWSQMLRRESALGTVRVGMKSGRLSQQRRGWSRQQRIGRQADRTATKIDNCVANVEGGTTQG